MARGTISLKKGTQRVPANTKPVARGTISLKKGMQRVPPTKAKAARGTISLGRGSRVQKKIAPVKKAAPARKAPINKAPARKAAADNTPVLSKWKKNADGSITGRISNSKNFKAGTQITTSPIRGIAKAGAVVKTGSGSKYRLN